MSTSLLLPLLLIAALGLATALHWAHPASAARLRWQAMLALLVALSALEFFLLSSQLALLFPAIAVLGLPLPLLIGPLWWRADSPRTRWSARRWMQVLFPAAVVLSLGVLGLFFVGTELLASAGALPAQTLVFASVVTALLCRPRLSTPRRSAVAKSAYAHR
ncbi:MAG: hypothetical protein ABI411_18385 [Tahibacter sp.]